MTSLGHNQYTMIMFMFIRASEHPSCGIREFGENYKSTKPSSGWCILLGEEPHVMDMVPLIPHVLWLYGKGLTSMGDNEYTVIVFWFAYLLIWVRYDLSTITYAHDTKGTTLPVTHFIFLHPLLLLKQEVDVTPFTTMDTNIFNLKYRIIRIVVILRCRYFRFGRYRSR